MITMPLRAVLRQAGLVMGAVTLGLGTIFQPKVKPDDHWATSPKVVLVTEVSRENSGGPPGL